MKTLLAALLFSAVPLAAMADSMEWNGFYGGVSEGAEYAHGTFSNNGTTWYNLVQGAPLHASGSSLVASVALGYNMQFGHYVVGIESDYSGQGAKTSATKQEYGGTTYGVTGSSKLTALGTARLRLGYALYNALLYGTAGLAYGNVESSISDYSYTMYDISATRLGWIAGGGAEYALDQHFRVKGEVLYYDMGSSGEHSFVYSSTNYGPYSDSLNGTIVRIGLSYGF